LTHNIKSLPTINCTATDNQKQENKTLHTRETEKPTLANKTNYFLAWYAFHDLGQQMDWAPFLQSSSPHEAQLPGWERETHD